LDHLNQVLEAVVQLENLIGDLLLLGHIPDDHAGEKIAVPVGEDGGRNLGGERAAVFSEHIQLPFEATGALAFFHSRAQTGVGGIDQSSSAEVADFFFGAAENTAGFRIGPENSAIRSGEQDCVDTVGEEGPVTLFAFLKLCIGLPLLLCGFVEKPARGGNFGDIRRRRSRRGRFRQGRDGFRQTASDQQAAQQADEGGAEDDKGQRRSRFD